jgi:CTP:molybdopterin cytidylyltransferase MocA
MVVMPAMMPQHGGGCPTDLCAVVLSAGEGSRLRPLTLVRPKVLCPVGGTPLVDLAIERARTAVGHGAVAVNVHHDRVAVEDHLAGRAHLSVEPGEARGTAGALGLLRPWIGGRGTLVLNGDTWAPGDLGAAADGWDRERLRVLVAGDDRLGPTSSVVAAFMPWPDVVGLPSTPAGLWEVSWRASLDAGRVDVIRWDGPCRDCGTPARYLAANMEASGGHPVVGAGARVAGSLVRSVVWDGAEVRRGEALMDAIRTDEWVTVLVR